MNAPLGVSEMVRGKPLFSDANDKMSSVIAYVYKNHSLVFVGTKSGRVKKVRRRFGFSLLNVNQTLGIGGLLLRRDRSSEGRLTFRQISWVSCICKWKRCVCMEKRESERRKSVCVCVYMRKGDLEKPLRGFYFSESQAYLVSLNILLIHCTIYHTYTSVCSSIRRICSAFPSLWTRIKPRALGADCSTHQHVAELARQHRSACCRNRFHQVSYLRLEANCRIRMGSNTSFKPFM